MSELRDRARFKEALVEIDRIFAADEHAYIGAGYINPLERATRRHVVDVMLTGLGWNLDHYGRDTLEEVQTKGETTLFLDYLCRNPRTKVPLLIVEAKAWAKPFVFPSASIVEGTGRDNAMDRAASMLGRAIDYAKFGSDTKSPPLTQEWMNWIAKARDYVRTVHDNTGHSVQRVVITSGQWLVIFCDPAAAFLSHDRDVKAKILCFYRRDLIERSDEIHGWLAWKALIRDAPTRLTPAQLRSYICGPDIESAFRALWVVYRKDGAHFDLHPNLTLYPALIIKRSDGILVTAVDENQRFIIPHDPSLLIGHISSLAEASDTLLHAVNAELKSDIVPAGVEKFPGFQQLQAQSLIPDLRPTLPPGRIDLLRAWRSGANEFLLATGSHSHFLHPEPTVAGCRFHDWTAGHAIAQHQGDHPIAARSVKPRSFFRSTENHHCAHRQVHARRETRCQIDAFEEFLCCRACTLQTFCWPVDEEHRLPCGS